MEEVKPNAEVHKHCGTNRLKICKKEKLEPERRWSRKPSGAIPSIKGLLSLIKGPRSYLIQEENVITITKSISKALSSKKEIQILNFVRLNYDQIKTHWNNEHSSRDTLFRIKSI